MKNIYLMEVDKIKKNFMKKKNYNSKLVQYKLFNLKYVKITPICGD